MFYSKYLIFIISLIYFLFTSHYTFANCSDKNTLNHQQNIIKLINCKDAIHPDLWKTMVNLGDLAMQGNNYKSAYQFYESALISMDSSTTKKIKLSKQKILQVKNKTENAFLLASTTQGYIAPLVNENNQLQGLNATKIGHVTFKRRQYPIRFNYNDNKLRSSDLKYAKLLQRHLIEKEQPDITLIGHTDIRGSHAYNDRLSLQRAKSIQKFLENNGYKGIIQVEGKGEREPVFLPAKIKKSLSKEKWHQLCRRVETIIK